MTGAQTDRQDPHPYQQAVCLLLKLTPALIIDGLPCAPGRDWGEEAFDAWYDLRRTIEIYNLNRSTLLAPPDRERMVGALRFAHDLAHKQESFTPRTETCPCATAGVLRDLALVLESAREGYELEAGMRA